MQTSAAANCPCKRMNCKRHGDCAACIAHHKDSRYPPQCRSKKGRKLQTAEKQGEEEKN